MYIDVFSYILINLPQSSVRICPGQGQNIKLFGGSLVSVKSIKKVTSTQEQLVADTLDYTVTVTFVSRPLGKCVSCPPPDWLKKVRLKPFFSNFPTDRLPALLPSCWTGNDYSSEGGLSMFPEFHFGSSLRKCQIKVVSTKSRPKNALIPYQLHILRTT